MKLTSETILRDHYDVIVVGAGLGGITAASLLAKRGLSVLLVEQQNKPGGACTSFKREDHVFDVGAAMLYSFGRKGFHPFYHLINELEEPLEVVAHSTLARMTFEGQEIIFWPEVNGFLEELIALDPDEEKGLRTFYAELGRMYEHIVMKNEVISPPSELSPRQALKQLMSEPMVIFKMQKLLCTSLTAMRTVTRPNLNGSQNTMVSPPSFASGSIFRFSPWMQNGRADCAPRSRLHGNAAKRAKQF